MQERYINAVSEDIIEEHLQRGLDLGIVGDIHEFNEDPLVTDHIMHLLVLLLHVFRDPPERDEGESHQVQVVRALIVIVELLHDLILFFELLRRVDQPTDQLALHDRAAEGVGGVRDNISCAYMKGASGLASRASTMSRIFSLMMA